MEVLSYNICSRYALINSKISSVLELGLLPVRHVMYICDIVKLFSVGNYI